MIEKQLCNGKLFDNKIRTDIILKEARKYLEIENEDIELSKEQNVAFFSHCVYYMHIYNLDNDVQYLYCLWEKLKNNLLIKNWRKWQ